MRRILSIWFPWLATDRRVRGAAAGKPAVVAESGGRRLLEAVNRAARQQGLRPGMTLADSQAAHPDLIALPADPEGDRQQLESLADCLLAYSPAVALDSGAASCPGGGVWLDSTGCDHLWGGEAALLADIDAHLGRLGFTARLALADTAGAAWAWARFGAGGVMERGGQERGLASLPVAALRLPPETVLRLTQLGLRRIADLAAMPRASLATRFGRLPALRLEQAFGLVAEPLSPRRALDAPRVHRLFAEPMGAGEGFLRTVREALESLMTLLRHRQLGLRRLEWIVIHVDGGRQQGAIGTSRATRDAALLWRLCEPPLSGLGGGFGIDSFFLFASETISLPAIQMALSSDDVGRHDDLARLLDSLGNRLGFARIRRVTAQASHRPDRATQPVGLLAAGSAPPWPAFRRPLRLLTPPEPVEVMAPLPDAPPLLFRWRRELHHVHRAEGPERLAGEWWRADRLADRDYYCVEDQQGGRFWIYRDGPPDPSMPIRWYLEGIFP